MVGEAALGAAAPQHTLVGAKRLLGRKYSNPVDAAWLDSEEGAGLHTCLLAAAEDDGIHSKWSVVACHARSSDHGRPRGHPCPSC